LGRVKTYSLHHDPARGHPTDGLAYRKGRGWGTATSATGCRLICGGGASQSFWVFDVGARVKPCVSPDDPRRVIELLRERVPID
jgi:hypothetical protein